MHAPSPIVAPGAIDAVGWTWALGWICAGATQGLDGSSTVGSPGDAIAPPSRRLGSPLPKSVPFRTTASAAIVVLLLTRHSGSIVAPARTWTSSPTTEPAPTVAPGPIRVPFPIDAPASMRAPRPISQFSLTLAPGPICAPGSTSALGAISASGDTPGGRDPGSRFPHVAALVPSSNPCTDVSVSRAGSESTLPPVTVHPGGPTVPGLSMVTPFPMTAPPHTVIGVPDRLPSCSASRFRPTRAPASIRTPSPTCPSIAQFAWICERSPTLDALRTTVPASIVAPWAMWTRDSSRTFSPM